MESMSSPSVHVYAGRHALLNVSTNVGNNDHYCMNLCTCQNVDSHARITSHFFSTIIII